MLSVGHGKDLQVSLGWGVKLLLGFEQKTNIIRLIFVKVYSGTILTIE